MRAILPAVYDPITDRRIRRLGQDRPRYFVIFVAFVVKPRAMQPELQPAPAAAPPPRRRRRFALYALLVLIATCAWFGWREWDFRQAIREADTNGIYWIYDDPLEAIKADWRAAFRWGTWSGNRMLALLNNEGLVRVRTKDLVARLRPETFVISYCDSFETLGDFKGIGGVHRFFAIECIALKNLDALRGSTAIEEVYLQRCHGLRDLEFLKSLPKLRKAAIQECDGLPTGAVGALKAALPRVEVSVVIPVLLQ